MPVRNRKTSSREPKGTNLASRYGKIGISALVGRVYGLAPWSEGLASAVATARNGELGTPKGARKLKM